MPPPDVRRGPDATPGLSQSVKSPPTATDSATVHAGTGAGADLRAWGAAVEHLHAAGLAAAVPPFPAAWLRRRGVRADWVSAA